MCNESKTAASFVPEELLMPADAKHGVDGVERQELAPPMEAPIRQHHT